MNERIQELLLKAGFTNAYTDPQDGFELVFVDEEHTTKCTAKFAELLVRECADIAEQKYGNWYRINSPGDSPGITIKKHFGVEQ